MSIAQKTRIRELNDTLRQKHVGGKWVMTQEVAYGLNDLQRALLFNAIENDNEPAKGDDPHGEHDFGAVTFQDETYFWKIDYYARGSFEYGSEDPSNTLMTDRVLTIMHSSEY